jgi:AcrR family transcriptional regulator
MIRAMDVRERNRQATRDVIVGAAADLLIEGDAAALSVPAVSERSGVSVRTIYRYFPKKAHLIEAVGLIDDPATTAGPLPSLDGTDLHAWLSRGWSDDVQTPMLRAQLRTSAGVEVRKERRRRHRAFAYAVLDRWEIDAEGEAREAIADVLLLLTGGAARFEMTDVLEAPVQRATAAAAWAVEAVLTHARGDRPLPDPTTEIIMQPPTEGNSP